MAETRTKSRGRSGKGKFTDAPELLPSLFADPDGRGSRRWHEIFGRRPSNQKREGGWLLAKKEEGRRHPANNESVRYRSADVTCRNNIS